MATTSNLRESRPDRKASLLTDFYIDFMGTLVPGLFTIVLAATAIMWSGNLLCACLSFVTGAATPEVSTALSPLSDFAKINLDPYGTTCVMLVVAYVLGSIFYRQDPKVPDHISAQLAYKEAGVKDRLRLAVQPTSSAAEAKDIYPLDAQFPYFFLYEYLSGRGLDHLARLIPWQGRKPETHKYRTKMFINLIKIRLQFLIPDRCKDIVRNEAHVRLATSVWYSTRWLIMACAVAIAAVATAVLASLLTTFTNAFVPVLLFDVLVLILAWYIKRKVEKFIHYLRVREIVYVLETAHFAQQRGYDLNLNELARKTDNSANQPAGGDA